MPEINVLIPQQQLESMSRRDRKKQETRWRIYEAAITLIAERGYDEVKIEEICEAADASNAAFFHHFSNKAALISAYWDQLKANIREKLDAATTASSTEKLAIINREVLSTSQETAKFTAQMFGAITTGDRKLDMKMDTGITGTLTQIIREGQANGEFSKKWHPEVAATNLTATWLILPLATQSPDFPANPYIELLDLVLAGLKTD